MTASTPLLVTFGLYLVAMVVIGFIAWRRTQNFDDYILGGRSLGPFVTALAAGASDMSGWLLMGLPGALYLGGFSEAWIAFGLVAGAWINWKYVAGPLRVYTERTENALTLPDYFTHRFEDSSRVLRGLAAVVILVFFSVYCASGIVAGARLFESVFGLPYAHALWWGAAATIIYTLVGGFLAVSWTDTVQASLMFLALLVTPVVVIAATGGLTASYELIEQMNPQKLDWFAGGNLGLIGIVSLMAWGLGYFGQPHVLARFMAADGLHTIPAARRIGMTWMILTLLGALAVGFFANAYFAANPQHVAEVSARDGVSAAAASERVFIVLSQLLFNPWVAGILMSAILSAVMSTLSSQLLVASSALTEDLYRGFIRPQAGQRELVWVGRAAVLGVALLAIFIAWDPASSVLRLVAYAWAGFGAAFGPVVIISLFWSRMTRNGALAGMVVGALVVIIWKEFFAEATGLYEMVPGFLAGVVAIVLVSRMGQGPSPKMVARHQQVQAALQENGY